MKDLTIPQWKEEIDKDDNAVILDVRTPEEVDEGMLDNAAHIDIYRGQGFLDDIEKLDKSKNYYVYCRSGGRSGQACQFMAAQGLQAYNLMGGMMQWDGPVVQPQKLS